FKWLPSWSSILTTESRGLSMVTIDGSDIDERTGDKTKPTLDNQTSDVSRRHPALKHGAHSATAVLPGESIDEFEKLHSALQREFQPIGALEEDIILRVARLVWRGKNLNTLRVAERVLELFRRLVEEQLDRNGATTIYGDGLARSLHGQAEHVA